MTSPTRLYDLAAGLLAGVVAQFEADGLGASLPARRYVTGTEPTPECETLCVAWARVYPGMAGGVEQPVRLDRATVRAAELTVWLWRCLQAVPQGEGQQLLYAPSPELLDADAQVLMTDAYVVHRGVGRARWDATWTGADYTLDVSLGACVPIPPDGGVGGCRMSVLVELS